MSISPVLRLLNCIDCEFVPTEEPGPYDGDAEAISLAKEFNAASAGVIEAQRKRSAVRDKIIAAARLVDSKAVDEHLIMFAEIESDE